MNQSEFGRIAGVSDKAVSTWENGLKTPRMGAVQRLSDYFGIPKSAILDDTPTTEEQRIKELEGEVAEVTAKFEELRDCLTAYLAEVKKLTGSTEPTVQAAIEGSKDLEEALETINAFLQANKPEGEKLEFMQRLAKMTEALRPNDI